MQGKSIILGAFFYAFASIILLYMITPHALFSQHVYPFYKDPSIPDRLHTAIVEDTSNHALLARIFENKATFALDTLLMSLSRTLDPTFFFSLSPFTYYGQNNYTFFPALFFPFFLIGSVILIRKWGEIHKKYFFLLPLLLISLLIDVLFVPYADPLKLIPLLFTVQLITFLGIAEIWVKN